MYDYRSVRHVQLEITTKCNAACPQCPRNLHGYPHNNGYEEHSMTLAEAQHIFSPAFLAQLIQITINGNFGDIVMNPDALEIIKYFKQHTIPRTSINISTNGGAKNLVFWQQLGKLGVRVQFCIDGLEDTHSIYRRNTVYSTVIRNAAAFIGSGGHAVWRMINFEHNQHQHDQARVIAAEMGFKDFETSEWYGMHVPAGTPSEIVKRLQEESFNALKFSAVTERFATDNAMGGGGPSADYAAFIKNEQRIWSNIVKRTGIKAD